MPNSHGRGASAQAITAVATSPIAAIADTTRARFVILFANDLVNHTIGAAPHPSTASRMRFSERPFERDHRVSSRSTPVATQRASSPPPPIAYTIAPSRHNRDNHGQTLLRQAAAQGRV